MVDIAIVNASPIIFLSRGRHLELLRHFARRIVVPHAVASELHRKGADDISAIALSDAE